MVAIKEIKPQSGPQEKAFFSPADILIFGGAAGGGKTWQLIAEAIRHHKNPEFTGVIFRRTMPQLRGRGGVWDEMRKWFPPLGARLREGQTLDALFESGAIVSCGHLQHEKNKYDHMGTQYCYIAFDELTHFTRSQFFYLLTRNRSTCGVKPYVRCTCNPDASSWVADFIAWWIDPDTGFPIPERDGVIRYFITNDEGYEWGDSKAELIERHPELTENDILSMTFVASNLEDNKILLEADPGYRGKLRAAPKIERERLLYGNWRAREGSLIDGQWLQNKYHVTPEGLQFSRHRGVFTAPLARCRRFATIDTAGTSKQRERESKGDPKSASVCAIWDNFRHTHGEWSFNVLFLRYVWRAFVDWPALQLLVPQLLNNWQCRKVHIENAHYGVPLADVLKGNGMHCEMIGPVIPGMDDGSRGAKLERAIASGMLSAMEFGDIYFPADRDNWLSVYERELCSWTGLPKEPADQIDVTSYAVHVSKTSTQSWGGVVEVPKRPAFGGRPVSRL